MNEELLAKFKELEDAIAEVRYILTRKTGLGSNDIKGNITNTTNLPNNIVTTASIANLAVTTAKLASAAVTQAKFSFETATVTVVATATTGTATITAGSIVLGWRATGNQDQFIDNIAISGTTLTITLGASASADNTFSVVLLKSS